MADILPLLVTALSIISALVGGGVWLMKANYRLGQKTIVAQKELYSERLEGLKTVISNYEARLRENEAKLESTMKRLALTTSAIEETKKTMVSYVESTERRLHAFESKIIKLSNDVFIVTSKPKGN